MPTLNSSRYFIPRYNRPGVTVWNRLDSYPRSQDFDRGLKAEIRDAMWMLTRQWQFGEFKGEDAGSPVYARVAGYHQTPDKLIVKDSSVFYTADTPLEAVVECEEVHPTLRLRTQMGSMFLKLLKQFKLESSGPFFIQNFSLPDFSTHEDTGTRQFYTSCMGRTADGYEIYRKAKANISNFFKGLDVTALDQVTQKTIAETVLVIFMKWFEHLYLQASEITSAWQPSRMEYEFGLSLPAGTAEKKELKAPEYAGGRLEWTDFDLQHEASPILVPDFSVKGEQKTDVFLPTIVTFKGMPHPRFWQMEAGNIDFGKIEKSPAGIIGLLLAEYGLTFSNDWFLVPYLLKINTLCSVQGIVVTDVFGQKSYVSPVRMTSETNWQQFAMFHVANQDERLASTQAFYLPPVTGAMQESEPLERIYFMRDEMANLVWAIEDIVPAQTGGGKRVLQPEGVKPIEKASSEIWRYTLGTTVPDNWIPFVAVHKTGSNQEIQLQRAKMPGGKPPQSLLLSENQPVFFLEPQEVPRAGVIVERSVQRTRWLDGRTFTWIGRRKMTGRGEGSSGLSFDKIG